MPCTTTSCRCTEWRSRWAAAGLAAASQHAALEIASALGSPAKAKAASVRLVQGRMVMLAMKLMRGGTLRAALQQADKREALRWRAGCAAAKGFGCLPACPGCLAFPC